jgi:hypothetical protein
MNHKRKRPKNRRRGCLLCKPHKANGAKCEHFATAGLKAVYFARMDVRER